MGHAWSQDRGRIGGAALTVIVHAALGAALLWGLGVPVARVVERPLEVFDVLPPPPPAPEEKTVPPPPRKSEAPEPRRKFAPGREGAAAPPNLKGRAAEVVAPEPIVRLPVPPPVRAAPVPDAGFDRTLGAAPVRGPGTGAGGVGQGRGSGMGGDGDGGGGGWRDDSPPRLLRELRRGDYPRAAADAGIGGTVGLLYTITTEGRAVDCRVTRSSGDARLDADTCALVERRYRYDPSRDWRGRPVESRIEHNIVWEVRHIPAEPR